MSEVETHFGKLRKVETSLTVENWCNNQCILAGIKEISPYNSTWQEELLTEFGRKFFIVNGEIWESVEHIEVDSGGDIDVMIPNEDGTITFVMQFYNGGTCLGECIEYGLKKLKK